MVAARQGLIAKKKTPMGPKMVIVTNLGSVARKLYNIVTTLK